MTNQIEKIEDVAKYNLCTSCGTCVGMCPANALEMKINNGIYIPVRDSSKCEDCNLCIKVCPGYLVDFKNLNLDVFQSFPQDIIGNSLNSYLACSSSHMLRKKGQSGGVISSLLIFALERGIIDGAIVTRMSKFDPFLPETFIARTKGEIIEASKSKYCPVPANVILKELAEEDGHFAFVGLPCHIHGIRKVEKLNKDLKQKIVLHLGLFCDKNLNFYFHDFILSKIGVERHEVANFVYRSKEWRGYPGDILVQLKDGTTKHLHRKYRMEVKPFFTPWRCYLCFDKLNELADISFGDAWLPKFANDKEGMSMVVIRNSVGDSIFTEAVNEGLFELNKISNEEVIKAQKIEDKIKTFSGYCSASKIIGTDIPNYGFQINNEGGSNLLKLVSFGDYVLYNFAKQKISRYFFKHIPMMLLEKISALRYRLKSNSLSNINATQIMRRK